MTKIYTKEPWNFINKKVCGELELICCSISLSTLSPTSWDIVECLWSRSSTELFLASIQKLVRNMSGWVKHYACTIISLHFRFGNCSDEKGWLIRSQLNIALWECSMLEWVFSFNTEPKFQSSLNFVRAFEGFSGLWNMALPVREPSPRTVESVLELIYLWFPELVCVRQSANSVREPGSRTEQSFRVGYFVEFGNRLYSHELVYAIWEVDY